MYTIRELQKACKESPEGPEIHLAVCGSCSTQFFSEATEGYGKLCGLNLRVLDADYNQIEPQLLDPDSKTYTFHPDFILLWFASEKLYEDFLDRTPEKRTRFADEVIERIRQCWSFIKKNSKASILQMNFTEIDDKALGQLSCKTESTFIFQLRKLNALLQEEMSSASGVFPVDALSVQIDLGREKYFSDRLYYGAKMAASMDAFPFLAKAVIDVVKSLRGRLRKCVILDLDNTLWGGVIGDDGLNGIEIGELGKGHVFTNLQRWLKQLKEYGIILAVCSKNEETAAKEPFEKHEEMVLSLDDISVFVANWEDKAGNIRLIRDTLNIGMDSMVFLDDNPFERELVRQRFPEIEVPELPKDPSRWLTYLQRQNYFDTASCVRGEGDRSKFYQAEYERKRLEHTFESIDDYLKDLRMQGTAQPFEPLKYARISELTQRSNQFNLRTVRYTEEDIRRIAGDDRYFTLYYTLKDRFGDHGLVSVVILKKVSESDYFVDTWLMSCRVLKRGMEEYVMNRMVEEVRKRNCRIIQGEYIPTPKNKMVKDIYRIMGFTETGENRFQLDVDTYIPQKTYIRESGEEMYEQTGSV